MGAKKANTYNVSKRFTIWVETDIIAESLAEAVEQAEQMKPYDFAAFNKQLNDWEPLKGTSVSEDWT